MPHKIGTGRSYQIHQGQPVSHLRSVDDHTRLVSADPTNSPRSASTTPTVCSVDDRASVPANLTKFIIVGQYQSYMVWMTV